MNKWILTLAVLVMGAAAASAQDREISLDDFNQIEISKPDARVETSLGVAFPMYFGLSTLTNVNYKGAWAGGYTGAWAGGQDFLNFRTGKNFVYALDLASVHFKSGGFHASLGLRWTFMDFTFNDPKISLYPMEVAGTASTKTIYYPSQISIYNSSYDFNKSKIHASYLGVPLRVGFRFGKATVYAGASAELLTSGYTKYKRPKRRTMAKDIFSPFRATVEGGFCWGPLGVFAMYGLTPLFPSDLSDARTLTLGLILGM